MMEGFKFDPDRNLIVPSEKEDAAKEPEAEIVEENIEEDDEEYEIADFSSENIASIDDIRNLRIDVEEYIARQAAKMEISSKEELAKFIHLAELDLSGLNCDAIAPLNLTKGELNFIRENMEESLSKCWRNNSGELMVEPINSDKIVRFAEFLEKHKKAVGIAVLAEYILSYGSVALKDLAATGVDVEVHGEKVSLEELTDSDMIKKIDETASTGTPLDILKAYSPQNKFEEDNGTSFVCKINTIERDDNSINKTIFIEDIFWNNDQVDKLNSDLKSAGIHLDYESGGCPLDDFLQNREKIIDIFSQDLGIKREKVAQYFENMLLPDTSKITVVPYNEFEVNPDLNSGHAKELAQKRDDIYKQYNVYTNGEYNDKNWLNAQKALDGWWNDNKGNSTDSFEEALDKEQAAYNESPVSKLNRLKFDEQQTEAYPNSEAFRKLFLEDLNKSGYSIDKLKKEAQDNPKKVFEIISEVICKNVDYDYREAIIIDAVNSVGNLPKDTPGKQAMYDAGMSLINRKYAEGEPYVVLEGHKTVCHGYGKTYTAAFSFAKKILQEEGVPFDDVVCLWTTSDAQCHLWDALVTVDDNGNLIITYIDPTWYDESGELNAVDSDHYYGAIKEKIGNEHAAVLNNIKTWNSIVLQEKLNDIISQYDLSQYDPKTHKKEFGIKVNKKAYEEMKKFNGTRDTEVTPEDSSLERIMARIMSIKGESFLKY